MYIFMVKSKRNTRTKIHHRERRRQAYDLILIPPKTAYLEYRGDVMRLGNPVGIRTSGFLFLGLTFLAILTGIMIPMPEGKTVVANSRPVLLIDPGHGGADGGASSEEGLLESEANLKI